MYIPLNNSKGMSFAGGLVTGHPWMIHLSECGCGGHNCETWLLSKDTHNTRFLCMTGTHTIDRATITTRTMCRVIRNLTKGLGSSIYTTTVPLDGISLSLSVGSDLECTIHLSRGIICSFGKTKLILILNHVGKCWKIMI